MILSRRRYIVVAISVLALALWTSHVAAAAPTPRLKRHYDPRKAGTKKKKSPVKIKGHSHLSLDQYTQLRQLSTNLLTQYDPSQHVIVGLGRAPAALVSLLRQLTPEIAHHYPAGGLSGSGGEQALASLQTQHSNHFEKLLGDEVLSSGRTIVLVDRALSGRSLLVAKQLLETHLRQMGKATKVLAVGASEQPIAGLDGHLDISGLPEMQKLNWQMYDAIAPYRRHIVGQPHRVKDLKVNKAAKDFDRALRRRMLEDEELDSFLLQRFADSVLVSAEAERGVEGPEARLASRSKAARPEEPTQKGSDASGKKPLDLFGNLKRQLGHAVPEWLATRQKAPAAAPKKKRSLVTKDKPVTKEALKGPSPAESKSRPKRKEKSWEDILSEKPKTRRKGRKKAAGTLALRYDGENYALLSQDEYQGIRTAVESIVKNFPPHLYH